MIEFLFQLFIELYMDSIVNFSITGFIFGVAFCLFIIAFFIAIVCFINPICDRAFKLIIKFIYYGGIFWLLGLFVNYIECIYFY